MRFTVPERLQVQLVIALPGRATVIDLSVPPGTTVLNVIERARLRTQLPEFELTAGSFGIFGEQCSPDTLVKDGDRVEVYRPLSADPKALRRQRATVAARDRDASDCPDR